MESVLSGGQKQKNGGLDLALDISRLGGAQEAVPRWCQKRKMFTKTCFKRGSSREDTRVPRGHNFHTHQRSGGVEVLEFDPLLHARCLFTKELDAVDMNNTLARVPSSPHPYTASPIHLRGWVTVVVSSKPVVDLSQHSPLPRFSPRYCF